MRDPKDIGLKQLCIPLHRVMSEKKLEEEKNTCTMLSKRSTRQTRRKGSSPGDVQSTKVMSPQRNVPEHSHSPSVSVTSTEPQCGGGLPSIRQSSHASGRLRDQTLALTSRSPAHAADVPPTTKSSGEKTLPRKMQLTRSQDVSVRGKGRPRKSKEKGENPVKWEKGTVPHSKDNVASNDVSSAARIPVPSDTACVSKANDTKNRGSTISEIDVDQIKVPVHHCNKIGELGMDWLEYNEFERLCPSNVVNNKTGLPNYSGHLRNSVHSVNPDILMSEDWWKTEKHLFLMETSLKVTIDNAGNNTRVVEEKLSLQNKILLDFKIVRDFSQEKRQVVNQNQMSASDTAKGDKEEVSNRKSKLLKNETSSHTPIMTTEPDEGKVNMSLRNMSTKLRNVKHINVVEMEKQASNPKLCHKKGVNMRGTAAHQDVHVTMGKTAHPDVTIDNTAHPDVTVNTAHKVTMDNAAHQDVTMDTSNHQNVTLDTTSCQDVTTDTISHLDVTVDTAAHQNVPMNTPSPTNVTMDTNPAQDEAMVTTACQDVTMVTTACQDVTMVTTACQDVTMVTTACQDVTMVATACQDVTMETTAFPDVTDVARSRETPHGQVEVVKSRNTCTPAHSDILPDLKGVNPDATVSHSQVAISSEISNLEGVGLEGILANLDEVNSNCPTANIQVHHRDVLTNPDVPDEKTISHANESEDISIESVVVGRNVNAENTSSHQAMVKTSEKNAVPSPSKDVLSIKNTKHDHVERPRRRKRKCPDIPIISKFPKRKKSKSAPTPVAEPNSASAPVAEQMNVIDSTSHSHIAIPESPAKTQITPIVHKSRKTEGKSLDHANGTSTSLSNQAVTQPELSMNRTAIPHNKPEVIEAFTITSKKFKPFGGTVDNNAKQHTILRIRKVGSCNSQTFQVVKNQENNQQTEAQHSDEFVSGSSVHSLPSPLKKNKHFQQNVNKQHGTLTSTANDDEMHDDNATPDNDELVARIISGMTDKDIADVFLDSNSQLNQKGIIRGSPFRVEEQTFPDAGRSHSRTNSENDSIYEVDAVIESAVASILPYVSNEGVNDDLSVRDQGVRQKDNNCCNLYDPSTDAGERFYGVISSQQCETEVEKSKHKKRKMGPKCRVKDSTEENFPRKDVNDNVEDFDVGCGASLEESAYGGSRMNGDNESVLSSGSVSDKIICDEIAKITGLDIHNNSIVKLEKFPKEKKSVELGDLILIHQSSGQHMYWKVLGKHLRQLKEKEASDSCANIKKSRDNIRSYSQDSDKKRLRPCLKPTLGVECSEVKKSSSSLTRFEKDLLAVSSKPKKQRKKSHETKHLTKPKAASTEDAPVTNHKKPGRANAGDKSHVKQPYESKLANKILRQRELEKAQKQIEDIIPVSDVLPFEQILAEGSGGSKVGQVDDQGQRAEDQEKRTGDNLSVKSGSSSNHSLPSRLSEGHVSSIHSKSFKRSASNLSDKSSVVSLQSPLDCLQSSMPLKYKALPDFRAPPVTENSAGVSATTTSSAKSIVMDMLKEMMKKDVKMCESTKRFVSPFDCPSASLSTRNIVDRQGCVETDNTCMSASSSQNKSNSVFGNARLGFQSGDKLKSNWAGLNQGRESVLSRNGITTRRGSWFTSTDTPDVTTHPMQTEKDWEQNCLFGRSFSTSSSTGSANTMIDFADNRLPFSKNQINLEDQVSVDQMNARGDADNAVSSWMPDQTSCEAIAKQQGLESSPLKTQPYEFRNRNKDKQEETTSEVTGQSNAVQNGEKSIETGLEHICGESNGRLCVKDRISECLEDESEQNNEKTSKENVENVTNGKDEISCENTNEELNNTGSRNSFVREGEEKRDCEDERVSQSEDDGNDQKEENGSRDPEDDSRSTSSEESSKNTDGEAASDEEGEIQDESNSDSEREKESKAKKSSVKKDFIGSDMLSLLPDSDEEGFTDEEDVEQPPMKTPKGQNSLKPVSASDKMGMPLNISGGPDVVVGTKGQGPGRDNSNLEEAENSDMDICRTPTSEIQQCHMMPQESCPEAGDASSGIKGCKVPVEVLKNFSCCHHFVNGTCNFNYKDCKYPHIAPPPDLVHKNVMDCIMGEKINIDKIMNAYKYLCSLNYRPLPPMCLQKLFMMVINKGDANFALSLIPMLQACHLLDVGNCVRLLRLVHSCPNMKQYEKDIWLLFVIIRNQKSLITADAVYTFFCVFEDANQWNCVWEVLNYCCEKPGYCPPTHILHKAFLALQRSPKLTALVRSWIVNVQTDCLKTLWQANKGLFNLLQFNSSLMSLLLGRLESVRNEEEVVWPDINVKDDDWSYIENELELGDMVKSFMHRIKGAQITKNWKLLGDIYIDLCLDDELDNSIFIESYVDALFNPAAPDTNLSSFEIFITQVLDRFAEESPSNVFLEPDRKSLAQIGAELLYKFCQQKQPVTVYQLLYIMGQRQVLYHRCSTVQNMDVALMAMGVCLQNGHYLEAFKIMEKTHWGCLLHGSVSTPPAIWDVMKQLCHELMTKHECRRIQALLMALTIHFQKHRFQEVKTDLLRMYNALVHITLQQGNIETAMSTFNQFYQNFHSEHIHCVNLRALLIACCDHHLSDASLCVYNKCKELQVYGSIILNHPSNLCLCWDFTQSEMYMVVSDALNQYYNFLCERVVHGMVLSLHDFNLVIELDKSQTPQTAKEGIYLSRAACNPYHGRQILMNILQNDFSPGLLCQYNEFSIHVAPASLLEYMQVKDSNGRNIGIRLGSNVNSGSGRGRHFSRGRMQQFKKRF